MNNLRELWGKRFYHYMAEFQKYMKYVFTGHLAIVLVFTIGAGGYAYSEWLKEVPMNFPAALLTAVLISLAITFSAPVTLLKPADSVYFLPMETKLDAYLKQAIRWSTFSQLPLPYIIYIALLPLLSATETGTKMGYIGIAVAIILVKGLFIETEYSFRFVRGGEGVWNDRLIRFLLGGSLIYSLLENPLLSFIPAVLLVLYFRYWRKQRAEMPFPYDHFIELEQNRMMRFYRFANYFTDVPHLKGSVSRRSWLRMFMGSPAFGEGNPQSYLVRRTFIRTDDTFWLWVRLTVISLLGALFIPFPVVVFIFSGALAFASAIQLIYALRSGDEFRMDILFPIREDSRASAIRKTVRSVQWIQAAVVTVALLFTSGFQATPLLTGAVILIISEATIRLTGENKEL